MRRTVSRNTRVHQKTLTPFMRLLYLAQRVPFPPDRGDKIVTFNQVRHLAQKHEVIVACLAEDDADLDNARQLRSIVADVHAVRISPWRARLRALLSLARGEPFTLGYFNEPALRQKVRSLLEDGSIDAAMVFCSGIAQFIEHADALPRLVHLADMDSQKWKQYASASPPPMRWIYAVEARRLLRYERHLAETFDHCFLCSLKEVHDFQRLVGSSNVSYLANGVDLEYFAPAPEAARDVSMVFTGVMDYAPNVDCMQWFCSEILPLIRRRVPQATLTICGARPVQAVRDLARIAGVTVTGRVPDVRPYLTAASVAVAPLRIARGVQNKVLEAMAMSLPVVATPAALNGIDVEPGSEALVAESAAEFADQVCRLLADPALRERMGRSARRRIEDHYRWEVPLRTVESMMSEIAVRRRSPSPGGNAHARPAAAHTQ